MAVETRTVTKKDLIECVAQHTGHTRHVVRDSIQCLFERIIDELGAGNRIELRDFGVFEVKARAARTAQNPRTLERVAVPPRGVVKFKVGRRMRDRIEESPDVLNQLNVNVVARDGAARVDGVG